MNKRVLITGFAPFRGARTNPSEQLAQRFHGARLYGRTVVSRTLPVVFGESAKVLQQSIRETEPEMVVCLGLAGGRKTLSFERVAVNIDDARIPDNAGNQPVDLPIRRSGPAAHFSTLPIKAMHQTVMRKGWPAEVSNTAGTYVCNHVFYCLIHTLRRRPGVRGGFIHVPPPRRGFGLDQMEAALRAAVVIALRTQHDLPINAGRED